MAAVALLTYYFLWRLFKYSQMKCTASRISERESSRIQRNELQNIANSQPIQILPRPALHHRDFP